MNRFKRLSYPVIVVSIAPIILHSPLLIRGEALYWGTISLQFIPWRIFAWELLRSGQFPLWNDLSGMGAPLLANYQSAVFYPINWLQFIFASLGGIELVAWGQIIIVALNMILGGIGMVLFIRRIGLSNLAQAICGLTFGMSGYIVSRSGFMSINAAVAWLPWVLYTITELITHPMTYKRVIKSTLVFSILLFTGHAQITWYILLLAVFWVVFLSVLHVPRLISPDPIEDQFIPAPKISTRLFQSLGRLSLGFLLAIGITLIQILPTAELFYFSQRVNAVAYDYAMTYSYWPWRLLTLLAPNFFGSPVEGDYWGYGNYWEDHLYIGVAPFILALFAIISVIIGSRKIETTGTGNGGPTKGLSFPVVPLVIFLTFLIILSLVLAFGNNTPIYPWFYKNIPSFSLFQAPTRISIWAEFSLVVLAGIGIDRMRRPVGRALYWTRLATAGSFAIALGGGFTWFFLGNISPTFIRGLAKFSFFALCTGLLVLFNPLRRDQTILDSNKLRIWRWALIALIGVDLIIAGWGLNPGISLDFYTKTSQTVSTLRENLEGGRLYLPTDDEYSLKFDRFMRFDTFSIDDDWQNLRSVLLPNLNILDGIPSVNNFDPLLIARYANWFEGLDALRAELKSNELEKLYKLMGVSVVERLETSSVLGVTFSTIEQSKRMRWVACAVKAETEDEAWEMVFHGDYLFDKEVIIEGLDQPEGMDCSRDPKPAVIKFLDEKSNEYALQLSSDESGWLVISDVWYPGWEARVDGIPGRIYRANYLFRAIYIESGEHEVVFNYHPLSFWVGFYISLVLWMIIGLLYIRRYFPIKFVENKSS